MTHKDSDVLGRYVGAPAAPVQGEEVKAGEHTKLPWSIHGSEHGIYPIWAKCGPLNVQPAVAHGLSDAGLIVTAVNSHHAIMAENKACYQRIDELEKRIKRLEADLHECREYLEDAVDVVDGDYGEPHPNRAMQLVTMIDETLAANFFEPFPADSGA